MAALTRAFKRRAVMASDEEFIRYLEHLESSRGNRPLHQLAENTDALLDTLVSGRNTHLRGTSSATSLTFTGSTFTLASGPAVLAFPAVLGDGTTVASSNTVTSAQVLAAIATLSGGVLAADCWLVVQLDRTGSAAAAVTAYQTTAALKTALQADFGLALDRVPLAYCDGTHVYVFPAQRWLASGEALRNGLRDYVTQADVDRIDDVLDQDRATFMLGGITGSSTYVEFSWDSATGVLSWDADWRVRGLSEVDDTANGEFNNLIEAGSIELNEAGDIAYVVLDRSGTATVTPETAAVVPVADRKDAFVFAVWNEDDGRIYLADGTAISTGTSSPLGGTPPGVKWRFYGEWDGATAVMPLATNGGIGVTLSGSPVTPARYVYGGHHIMVYINGVLARGGAEGTVANGARYKEVDAGDGIGTSIEWLEDTDGSDTPDGVPLFIPGEGDYIEIFLPAGSSTGLAGKWQRVQVLELSPLQDVEVTTGAAASYSGVLHKAPTGTSPDAEWHAMADHTGARLVVHHDNGASGDPQTSTADGDGTFTSTGGVNDGHASTTYDPLTGEYSLVFTPSNRRVTSTEYKYLKATEDEEYQVEGVSSPTSMLPVFFTGGLVGSSYFHRHPGDDRSVLHIDATLAAGVSSVSGLAGALTLVEGDGISISLNDPDPDDITVAVDGTVPRVDVAHGTAAGDALEGAFGAYDQDPADDNPFVVNSATLVVDTADQKAGLQSLLTASPSFGVLLPLVGVEMLRETLRTTGVMVFARPAAADALTTTTVRLELGASVVLPQVRGTPNFSLRVLRPSTALSSTLAARFSGTALAAAGGEWVWVYAREIYPDPSTAFRGSTASNDLLHFSLTGPSRLDEATVDHGRMVHPSFLVVGGGVNRHAAVPLACLLTASGTEVLTNQTFDYASGTLTLPPQEFFDRTSASLAAEYVLAPGETGYLGLNGNAAAPLLPLDDAGFSMYVRAIRVRVRVERQAADGTAVVAFRSGNYDVGVSPDFVVAQVSFGTGADNSVDEVQLEVPLPVSNDYAGAVIDPGELSVVLNLTNARVRLYLEAVLFRSEFRSPT